MITHYDRECFQCDEKEKKLASAKYWLKHLINLIYSKDALEEAEVENALEEVAYALEQKIPETELQIVRKPKPKIEPMIDLIEEWKQFNNQYLKTL